MNQFILTLSCPDKVGIVAAVSGFLAQQNCNIMESAQFNDRFNNTFFMRVVFEGNAQDFSAIGNQFNMNWQINNAAKKPRVLILASKESHCLNHLLHKKRIGALDIEVPAVISNHPNLKEMADWHKIPFHQIANKDDDAILKYAEDYKADLVVLARYMQIISPKLCQALKGKAINIHHSFLPSFKGANPYAQAFERGVKIIGATAHYVTEALDEGPIIEQEVIRVDHTMTADQLKAAGSDIENLVLARAVQLHTQHRVLLNGNKTVVFK